MAILLSGGASGGKTVTIVKPTTTVAKAPTTTTYVAPKTTTVSTAPKTTTTTTTVAPKPTTTTVAPTTVAPITVPSAFDFKLVPTTTPVVSTTTTVKPATTPTPISTVLPSPLTTMLSTVPKTTTTTPTVKPTTTVAPTTVTIASTTLVKSPTGTITPVSTFVSVPKTTTTTVSPTTTVPKTTTTTPISTALPSPLTTMLSTVPKTTTTTVPVTTTVPKTTVAPTTTTPVKPVSTTPPVSTVLSSAVDFGLIKSPVITLPTTVTTTAPKTTTTTPSVSVPISIKELVTPISISQPVSPVTVATKVATTTPTISLSPLPSPLEKMITQIEKEKTTTTPTPAPFVPVLEKISQTSPISIPTTPSVSSSVDFGLTKPSTKVSPEYVKAVEELKTAPSGTLISSVSPITTVTPSIQIGTAYTPPKIPTTPLSTLVLPTQLADLLADKVKTTTVFAKPITTTPTGSLPGVNFTYAPKTGGGVEVQIDVKQSGVDQFLKTETYTTGAIGGHFLPDVKYTMPKYVLDSKTGKVITSGTTTFYGNDTTKANDWINKYMIYSSPGAGTESQTGIWGTPSTPISPVSPLSTKENWLLQKVSGGEYPSTTLPAIDTETQKKITVISNIEKFRNVLEGVGTTPATNLANKFYKMETNLAMDIPLTEAQTVALPTFQQKFVSKYMPSDTQLTNEIKDDLFKAGLKGQTSVRYGDQTITGTSYDNLVSKLVELRKTDATNQLSSQAGTLYKQTLYADYNVPVSFQGLDKNYKDQYKQLVIDYTAGNMTEDAFSKKATDIMNFGVQNLTDTDRTTWYKNYGIYQDATGNQVTYKDMQKSYEKKGYENVTLKPDGSVSYVIPQEVLGKEQFDKMVTRTMTNDKSLTLEQAKNQVTTKLAGIAVLESPLGITSVVNALGDISSRSTYDSYIKGLQSGRWSNPEEYAHQAAIAGFSEYQLNNMTKWDKEALVKQETGIASNVKKYLKKPPNVNEEIYRIAAKEIGYEASLRGETTPVNILGFNVGQVSGPWALPAKIASSEGFQEVVMLPLMMTGVGYGVTKGMGALTKYGTKLITKGESLIASQLTKPVSMVAKETATGVFAPSSIIVPTSRAATGTLLSPSGYITAGKLITGGTKVAGYSMLGAGVVGTGTELVGTAMVAPNQLPAKLFSAGLSWGAAAKGSQLAQKPLVQTEIGVQKTATGETTVFGQKYIGLGTVKETGLPRFRINVSPKYTKVTGVDIGTPYEAGTYLPGKTGGTWVEGKGVSTTPTQPEVPPSDFLSPGTKNYNEFVKSGVKPSTTPSSIKGVQVESTGMTVQPTSTIKSSRPLIGKAETIDFKTFAKYQQAKGIEMPPTTVPKVTAVKPGEPATLPQILRERLKYNIGKVDKAYDVKAKQLLKLDNTKLLETLTPKEVKDLSKLVDARNVEIAKQNAQPLQPPSGLKIDFNLVKTQGVTRPNLVTEDFYSIKRYQQGKGISYEDAGKVSELAKTTKVTKPNVISSQDIYSIKRYQQNKGIQLDQAGKVSEFEKTKGVTKPNLVTEDATSIGRYQQGKGISLEEAKIPSQLSSQKISQKQLIQTVLSETQKTVTGKKALDNLSPKQTKTLSPKQTTLNVRETISYPYGEVPVRYGEMGKDVEGAFGALYSKDIMGIKVPVAIKILDKLPVNKGKNKWMDDWYKDTANKVFKYEKGREPNTEELSSMISQLKENMKYEVGTEYPNRRIAIEHEVEHLKGPVGESRLSIVEEEMRVRNIMSNRYKVTPAKSTVQTTLPDQPFSLPKQKLYDLATGETPKAITGPKAMEAFAKFQRENVRPFQQAENPWKQSKIEEQVKLAKERLDYGGKTREEYLQQQEYEWATFKRSANAKLQSQIKKVQDTYTPEQLKTAIQNKKISMDVIKRMPILETYGNKIAVTKAGQQKLIAERLHDAKLRTKVNTLRTETSSPDSMLRYQRQHVTVVEEKNPLLAKKKASISETDSFLKYQRQHTVTETVKPKAPTQKQYRNINLKAPTPKTKAELTNKESYFNWLKEQRIAERQAKARQLTDEQRKQIQITQAKQEVQPKPFLRAEMKVVEGVPIKSEYTGGIKRKMITIKDLTQKPEGTTKPSGGQEQRGGQTTVLEKPKVITKTEEVVIPKEVKTKYEPKIETVKTELRTTEKALKDATKISSERVQQSLMKLRDAAVRRLRTKYTTPKERVALRDFIREMDVRISISNDVSSGYKSIQNNMNLYKRLVDQAEQQLKSSSGDQKLQTQRQVDDLKLKLGQAQTQILIYKQKQLQIQKLLDDLQSKGVNVDTQIDLILQQPGQGQTVTTETTKIFGDKVTVKPKQITTQTTSPFTQSYTILGYPPTVTPKQTQTLFPITTPVTKTPEITETITPIKPIIPGFPLFGAEGRSDGGDMGRAYQRGYKERKWDVEELRLTRFGSPQKTIGRTIKRPEAVITRKPTTKKPTYTKLYK